MSTDFQIASRAETQTGGIARMLLGHHQRADANHRQLDILDMKWCCRNR
jgi:hypothetical protein